MTTKSIAFFCALIAPVAIAIAQTETTVTRETVTTTQDVMKLDSTHMLTVQSFAPGDKITVQTAPNTQPIAVKLDKAVVYVDHAGNPISPSSIQSGSRVRLDFIGTDTDRMVTRVVLLAAD